MVNWSLYIGLCCYNILDIYQTIILFSLGVWEGNPLYRLLMRNENDILPIIVVKLSILIILGIFIYKHQKKVV